MTPSNILYLSHGGGPFPLLGEPSHQHMVEQLKAVKNTFHLIFELLTIEKKANIKS